MNLISPKTKVPAGDLRADSMRLSLLVLAQLFSKVAVSDARSAGATIVTQDHSRSCNKPTTDCVSLYNNTSLIKFPKK